MKLSYIHNIQNNLRSLILKKDNKWEWVFLLELYAKIISISFLTHLEFCKNRGGTIF